MTKPHLHAPDVDPSANQREAQVYRNTCGTTSGSFPRPTSCFASFQTALYLCCSTDENGPLCPPTLEPRALLARLVNGIDLLRPDIWSARRSRVRPQHHSSTILSPHRGERPCLREKWKADSTRPNGAQSLRTGDPPRHDPRSVCALGEQALEGLGLPLPLPSVEPTGSRVPSGAGDQPLNAAEMHHDHLDVLPEPAGIGVATGLGSSDHCIFYLGVRHRLTRKQLELCHKSRPVGLKARQPRDVIDPHVVRGIHRDGNASEHFCVRLAHHGLQLAIIASGHVDGNARSSQIHKGQRHDHQQRSGRGGRKPGSARRKHTLGYAADGRPFHHQT